MPELRRQPRVAYHTKVRLRSPGREHSVVARVQNLSASGIFVTGADVPEPGSDVLCRLLVAGERRTIKGRVAWVRPPQDEGGDAGRDDSAGEGFSGAGIRFLEVTDRDAELLARMVEPEDTDRSAVDVWFEGLRAPIKSHAVISGDSLLISTRLPFLRLNSPVRVSFVRRGVEEVRSGLLDAVTLEPSAADGIPRLQLVVSTPQQEEARGTIEVRTPSPEPTAARPEVRVSDPVAPPPLPRGRDDDRTQRLRTEDIAPRSGSGPQLAPVVVTPAPPRRLRAHTLPLVAVTVLAGVGAMLALRVVPAITAREAPRALVATPAPLPRAAALPIVVPTPPEPAALPSGALLGEASKLFIPVVGTTRGMTSYLLADPPGVAIILPRARPRLGLGVHGIDGGVFKRMLVQRRGPGSHVRVFFEGERDAHVFAEATGLRVALRSSRKARR